MKSLLYTFRSCHTLNTKNSATKHTVSQKDSEIILAELCLLDWITLHKFKKYKCKADHEQIRFNTGLD